MLVYHGSNLIVEKPRLVVQNRFLDFGHGFYTTANIEQAKSFAQKVFNRKRSGSKQVSIYEIDIDRAFAECTVLNFDGPNDKWIDFVAENRSGVYSGTVYDIIYGPVANDDVYTTFTLYQTGVLSKTQTLEALKVKELYNQLVFTSDKALSYLKFVGTVPQEEL